MTIDPHARALLAMASEFEAALAELAAVDRVDLDPAETFNLKRAARLAAERHPATLRARQTAPDARARLDVEALVHRIVRRTLEAHEAHEGGRA